MPKCLNHNIYPRWRLHRHFFPLLGIWRIWYDLSLSSSVGSLRCALNRYQNVILIAPTYYLISQLADTFHLSRRAGYLPSAGGGREQRAGPVGWPDDHRLPPPSASRLRTWYRGHHRPGGVGWPPSCHATVNSPVTWHIQSCFVLQMMDLAMKAEKGLALIFLSRPSTLGFRSVGS